MIIPKFFIFTKYFSTTLFLFICRHNICCKLTNTNKNNNGIDTKYDKHQIIDEISFPRIIIVQYIIKPT